MAWLIRFLNSSIGSKLLVALTGIGLVLFVAQHVVSNMIGVFGGQDALNSYAAYMKADPLFLWTARSLILVALLVHVFLTLRLTLQNRAARPEKYGRYKRREKGISSRLMALSGLTLLAFIIYHLMHFTIGGTHPEHFHMLETLPDGSTRHDVYSMLVLGFQQVPVSVGYILAMFLLAVHLSHGVTSLFQTLGLSHPKWDPLIKWAGPVTAAAIALGFISMPVAVLIGFVTLPGAS